MMTKHDIIFYADTIVKDSEFLEALKSFKTDKDDNELYHLIESQMQRFRSELVNYMSNGKRL